MNPPPMRLPLPRLKPWQWGLLALGVLAAAVLAVVVIRQTGAMRLLNRETLDRVIAFVVDLGPVPYFAAIAILPAFGFPVMVLYFGAGVFGRPTALLGSYIGSALNIALTYALARWLFHPPIERLMVRMGRKVPKVRHEDRWLVTLLLRITPGPPFFVQSYLLALGGVPFGAYLLVSVPIAWAFATGFVLVGDSLLSGKSGQLILGVSLVIVVLVAVRFTRKIVQRRAPHALADSAGDEAPARAGGPTPGA